MSWSLFHDSAPAEFLAQFQQEGDGWLYRYQGTGPAYRVTDAEKSASIVAFDRWQRWSGWMAVLIWCGLLYVLWKTDTLPPIPPEWPMPIGMILSASSRYALDLIGFRAALRTLGNRAPIAPELAKAARAQLALDRTSPTELVGTSFAAAGFLFLSYVAGWPASSIGWLLFAGFTWMAWRAIMQLIRERQARTIAPVMSPAT